MPKKLTNRLFIRNIRSSLYLVIIFYLLLSNVTEGSAKNRSTRTTGQDLISVFPDFPFHQQFVRENITFVNYVRDREMAEVHIMMTRYVSGSAGENYVISFIGRNRFEGINNVITYWAPGTNTVYETRRGLVDMITIGLVPYIAGTRLRRQLSVNVSGDRQIEREAVDDPWKSWVFEVYGGANFFKEETQSRFDARWGGSADKITEDWKIRIRPYFNINQRTFKRDDGDIIRKTIRHGFNGNVVKSINDNWSAGFFSSIMSSTFHNLNFNTGLSTGVEYSLFPYSEASRRSITMVYRIGASYNDYIEQTIFLKETEVLASQSVNVSAAYQQPWGGFRASLTGSHHFHDFTSNRVSLFMRLDLRVVKGLSLNLQGNFDYINDLVSLPAGELSLEDILLQQRRQATNYQMSGSLGLAYTFGSQFSNVVNTRF
jgi:hypothetical protein